MLPEKKGALTAVVLISAVFLGFALFADVPAMHQGFLVADQATYFSIAQSLAYDHDLEYTKKDLVRYKEQFWAGPQGLFLKRIKTASGEKLYYAKSMAYALFAAPFVRVFGPNGPLVFHAVLIFLLLLMGFSYFSLQNSPGLSVLKIGTFLFASVAGAYTFWLAPDFFNLFCVFAVLYLWLYKHRRLETGATAEKTSSKISINAPGKKTFRDRWTSFLLSDASDYCAAAVAGIAAYAKPPNMAVFGPLVLWTILKKRRGKAVLLVLIFVLAFGALFGTNFLLTGEWNYQGGDRKSFYTNFPFERPDLTFDNIGDANPMSSDGYLKRAFSFSPALIPINFLYFIFGRFSGMVWYFFPALLALILFFLGKKTLDRWLLLVAIVGEILIYVVLMPDNFGGGGGSLANRYFMGIYPLFFFLPRLKIRPRIIAVEWAAAALLIAPILLSPIQAAHSPAAHAKHFPYTLFPVEKTLINELPTNANPMSFRQQWGKPIFQDRFLYFLNDNYNPKHDEEDGWWTLGDRRLEFILRTSVPDVKEIVFHLQNSPRLENEVTVWVGGTKKKITLGPRLWGELRFPVGKGFVVEPAHMYRVRIQAAKGCTPYFENENSDEKRWLGVFFRPELISR